MKNGSWMILLLLLLLSCLSQGNLGPTSDDNDFCHDDSCIENERRDLRDRGETSISNFISDTLKYVGKAAFKTIYKLSEEVLKDIADIVRVVFSEEAFNIVSSAGKSALNILFDTDMVFTSVGATVLSVSIFVAMILINYLLLNYFSIISVLTLDAAIFLIHGLFGPIQMAMWFLSACSVIYQVLKITISHPYMSSIVLVMSFCFSCCGWPILRRRSKYLRRADDTVYVIENRLSNLETRLEVWVRESRERDDRLKAQLTRIENLLLTSNNHIMNPEP